MTDYETETLDTLSIVADRTTHFLSLVLQGQPFVVDRLCLLCDFVLFPSSSCSCHSFRFARFVSLLLCMSLLLRFASWLVVTLYTCLSYQNFTVSGETHSHRFLMDFRNLHVFFVSPDHSYFLVVDMVLCHTTSLQHTKDLWNNHSPRQHRKHWFSIFWLNWIFCRYVAPLNVILYYK